MYFDFRLDGDSRSRGPSPATSPGATPKAMFSKFNSLMKNTLSVDDVSTNKEMCTNQSHTAVFSMQTCPDGNFFKENKKLFTGMI